MSDNEDNVNNEIVPVKEKKPRTEAQIEATKRMLEKRKEIDSIKRGHREALKTEKELNLNDKKTEIKEVKDKELQQKMSSYKSEESESEEEVIVKAKPKAKPKKKTKIVYESSSESEEEVVYVKRSKSKPKKSKKKIVYESESEEEEPQQNLQQNIAKSSNDQLKYDLHNERMHNCLRSLGYIA